MFEKMLLANQSTTQSFVTTTHASSLAGNQMGNGKNTCCVLHVEKLNCCRYNKRYIVQYTPQPIL